MSIIHDALKKVQHSLDRNYGRTTKPSGHEHDFTLGQQPKTNKPVSPHDVAITRPDQWPVKAFLLMAGTVLICLGIILVLILKIIDKDSAGHVQPSPLVEQRLQQIKHPPSSVEAPPRQAVAPAVAKPVATANAPAPSAPAAIRQPTTQAPSVDENQLILGGIMVMGDERVALINDDVYALGDTVENKEIVDITLKEVVLREPSGALTTLKVLNRR